jgi:quinol-cytochrome oxidoreductase complex cytochrome b subunit
MNWKRLLPAALAVYVAVQAIDFVLNMLFMKSANEQLKSLWRPDMASKMWLMYVFGALVALLFTYIFVQGREGKGQAEGVRFGLIMWLFITVPMNVAWWVMLPIPHFVLVRWILFGLLEMLVAGILVAAIYKPAAPAKAQP